MNKAITNYWYKHYCDQHCTLCGNKGYINTIGVKTPAGVEVGKLNYCICPNGQLMRKNKISLEFVQMTEWSKVTDCKPEG